LKYILCFLVGFILASILFWGALTNQCENVQHLTDMMCAASEKYHFDWKDVVVIKQGE
jgi:hypothetical protein